ncbi:sensor domain-containing diguanylate cyclase [Amantichitinum ursilacus]|uniref:diguanylate cyclase n=1 Tax=Amantichitinum ursilacus TaxID=857265 RepID=A0A0N0GPH7_9NEIS|nr:sensor domain-containing diguanylate cyclase [Amantichitinum ursilacus]KPC53823.1 Response regulator PleD [Amantichitinum ursilacus]
MPRKNLRSVLMVAFAAVSAIMALSLSLVLGHLATERQREDIGEAISELAGQLRDQLDRGMNQRVRDIQIIAALRQVRDPSTSKNDNRAVLDKLAQTFPNYAFIGMASPDGIVQYATHGLLEGKSVAERPWFQAGKRDLFTGDIHEAKLLAKLLSPQANGEPLRFVDVATPVFDLNGQFLGVLGAHLSWAWARGLEQNVFTPARRNQGIETFVLNRSGEIILAPPGVDPATVKLPRNLPTAEAAGEPVTWPDGNDYLTSLVLTHGEQNFAGLGWKIVVRQPTRIAFAPVRSLQLTILVVGAIGALVFALLGAWLAEAIARPMLRLAEAAERLQQGESGLEIPLENQYSESARLSASLRHLVAGLNDERSKLATLNQALEEQVHARTDMLDRANMHLLSTLEERASMVKQLEELASTDSLTGLLNRRAFWLRADMEYKRAARSGTPLSLVMFDIDHFKRINDAYGHDVGDEALRQLANVVSASLREIDLVARMGGEEFALLLPETAVEGAQLVAERLREQVAQIRVPVATGGVVSFTASFGISAWPQELGLDHALIRADQALYNAKNGGRDQVRIYEAQS